MSGKAILIVGARGTGKTTTSRRLISKSHPDARLILDVNGEYKDLFPRPPIPFKEFGKLATQVKNAVILIEESTIFLSNRGYDGDITELLVKARHNNNTIIFVYHSLIAIPTYIYNLSNVIILHKTADNIDKIDERFNDPRLIEIFKEVSALPWQQSPEGKRYSLNKVYTLF